MLCMLVCVCVLVYERVCYVCVCVYVRLLLAGNLANEALKTPAKGVSHAK